MKKKMRRSMTNIDINKDNITEITDGNGKVVTIDKDSKVAKKHLK